jgi:hypothetical protein
VCVGVEVAHCRSERVESRSQVEDPGHTGGRLAPAHIGAQFFIVKAVGQRPTQLGQNRAFCRPAIIDGPSVAVPSQPPKPGDVE